MRGERLAVEHGCRQHAVAKTPPIAGEVAAQHHVAPAQGVGEAAVVVDGGGEFAHGIGQPGVAFGLSPGQLAQRVEAGAAVGLAEHQVKAQGGDALPFEQFLGQRGQPVAPPGPTPDLGKAALIDVDDDDALVERAWRGQAQSHVVQHIVEATQRADFENAAGVKQQRQHHQHGPGGPLPPAQLTSPQPWLAARRHATDAGLQCCTNCIWMPASSSMSPSLSGTGSPWMGAPLSVGVLAPSTCATT